MKVVIAMALLGLGFSGCADLNKGLFDKAVLGTEPAPALPKSADVRPVAKATVPTQAASEEEVEPFEEGSAETVKAPVTKKAASPTKKAPVATKVATKNAPAPVSAPTPVQKPKARTAPKTAEEPRSAPLTKDQCMAKYPMKTGQLSRRQHCINALVKDSAAKMNASQKTIVSDCSRKLLTLADSADKSAISLDAYNARKQQLRGECNTAIRKAGGATTKSTKTASSKEAATRKPASGTASKTATPKSSRTSTTGSAAKAH
jgi:hypothetical protein